MYARTLYDVVVDQGGLQFHAAGPLFERYSVKLQGRIDRRWADSYQEVVTESPNLARFRFDASGGSVSFTCRSTDGPVEVMSILKRLEELVERVNHAATAAATASPNGERSNAGAAASG